MNDQGFRNFGGVENVTFTLRENVTFHDGSEWNATVCKWNIDRMMLVMGNFTGNGDSQYHYSYFGFGKAVEWEKYFIQDQLEIKVLMKIQCLLNKFLEINKKKCSSRESNPGNNVGNVVYYH